MMQEIETTYIKRIRLTEIKPMMLPLKYCNTPKEIRIIEKINDIGREFIEKNLSVEFDEFSLREAIMDFCIRPENSNVAVKITHHINKIISSFIDEFQ